MTAEAQVHKIRWYVWAGGEKMPRTAKMRGTWGYDAACTCGWETRSGGAVRSYIEREVWAHKYEHDLATIGGKTRSEILTAAGLGD